MTNSSGGPDSDFPRQDPPRNPVHPPSVPPSLPPSRKPGAPPVAPPSGQPDDDVLLTTRQGRRALRDARRQAKDAAYERRKMRKKVKDGTFWRGQAVVDARGLAKAFPERGNSELNSIAVRHRITHGVVLVLLLALVVTGLVLAAMVQRGELELRLGAGERGSSTETCPAATYELPDNKNVTVNVLNAGSTEGQAGKVAAELKERGFLIQNVSNRTTEYAAAAVVVSGPSGHAAALSMQRNFPKTEYVQDNRLDSTVDVILTSQFKGLIGPSKVSQKPGVLSCPRLSPPPSAVPSPTAGAVSPAVKP